MSIIIHQEYEPGRPFIKWAGGKGKLLPQLSPLFPEKYGTYFEPFLGGGAVFFHLQAKHPDKHSMLTDINHELINAYTSVSMSTIELIDELAKMKNTKEFFLEQRRKLPGFLSTKEAARFIYLNKTCFNGLYRVNSKGQFNVPFGNYKNPKILDTRTIINAERALRKAFIMQRSFEEILKAPSAGDFVYIDPPYMPVSKTSSFTSYTADGFDFEKHSLLSDMCRDLKRKKVKVMISNSDTPEVRKLYKGFKIYTIQAPRSINCNGLKRGEVSELVICSY